MHGFDYSVPHFITQIRGTLIVVTPKIVSDVLRVLRVEYPDYPGYERLRTVTKDELISAFCVSPSNWGEFTNKSLNKFEIPRDYLHLPWKDYKN